jgi:hypothetical protein
MNPPSKVILTNDRKRFMIIALINLNPIPTENPSQ